MAIPLGIHGNNPYPMGLFPEGWGAVNDVDATWDRSDDTTTGEIVDGISLVVEQGIEIKEREISGFFIWSKDEADALGKSLVKRFLRLGG